MKVRYRSLLVQQKGFLFSLCVAILFTLCMMVITFGFAANPGNIQDNIYVYQVIPRLITEHIPTQIARFMPDGVSPPANLTREQWNELGSVLEFMPDAADELKTCVNKAQQRIQAVCGFKDFVDSHFNRLPLYAQQNWKELNALHIDDDLFNTDLSGLQKKFNTTTLTVADVITIIHCRDQYDIARNQIQRSSILIGNILPLLDRLGLQRPGVISWDPRYSGSSFDPDVAGTPVSLPYIMPRPLDFTAAQVSAQISQPPLSAGENCAERAGMDPLMLKF